MGYYYSEAGCGCARTTSCSTAIYAAVAVTAGLLFGAGVGVLYGFGLIANSVILVSVALGLALGVLALFMTGTMFAGVNSKICLCRWRAGLLIGIFGTLLFALAAFAADVAVVSVASAIIVGLLAFFFALLLVTLLFVLHCLASSRDCR